MDRVALSLIHGVIAGRGRCLEHVEFESIEGYTLIPFLQLLDNRRRRSRRSPRHVNGTTRHARHECRRGSHRARVRDFAGAGANEDEGPERFVIANRPRQHDQRSCEQESGGPNDAGAQHGAVVQHQRCCECVRKVDRRGRSQHGEAASEPEHDDPSPRRTFEIAHRREHADHDHARCERRRGDVGEERYVKLGVGAQEHYGGCAGPSTRKSKGCAINEISKDCDADEVECIGGKVSLVVEQQVHAG